jgi:hypothetical protein
MTLPPRSKGRTGRPWRTAAAAVRAQVRAGAPCWICHRPIDLSLPPRSPWSFSVDHVVPLQYGGAELDPSNLRPSHLGCNARRGNQARPRRRRPARLPVW